MDRCSLVDGCLSEEPLFLLSLQEDRSEPELTKPETIFTLFCELIVLEINGLFLSLQTPTTFVYGSVEDSSGDKDVLVYDPLASLIATSPTASPSQVPPASLRPTSVAPTMIVTAVTELEILSPQEVAAAPSAIPPTPPLPALAATKSSSL